MADYGSGPGVVVKIIIGSLPELDNLIIEESPEIIEVDPGETKKLVAHTESGTDWILNAIGATDNDYSEYWLKIGDKETTHTKEPLGLFNNPFRFEPTISVPKGVEAAYYVKLDAGAPGPASFIAKMMGYIL